MFVSRHFPFRRVVVTADASSQRARHRARHVPCVLLLWSAKLVFYDVDVRSVHAALQAAATYVGGINRSRC
jgi:hypothetical protein